MNPGRAFAIIQIALSLGASISYGIARDWRHCIYWGAATVLTASVTF